MYLEEITPGKAMRRNIIFYIASSLITIAFAVTYVTNFGYGEQSRDATIFILFIITYALLSAFYAVVIILLCSKLKQLPK